MFSIDLQGICSQYAVFLSMRVILCESVGCMCVDYTVSCVHKEGMSLSAEFSYGSKVPQR